MQGLFEKNPLVPVTSTITVGVHKLRTVMPGVLPSIKIVSFFENTCKVTLKDKKITEGTATQCHQNLTGTSVAAFATVPAYTTLVWSDTNMSAVNRGHPHFVHETKPRWNLNVHFYKIKQLQKCIYITWLLNQGRFNFL